MPNKKMDWFSKMTELVVVGRDKRWSVHTEEIGLRVNPELRSDPYGLG